VGRGGIGRGRIGRGGVGREGFDRGEGIYEVGRSISEQKDDRQESIAWLWSCQRKSH